MENWDTKQKVGLLRKEIIEISKTENVSKT